MKTDVIIVGAGPVGLLLANLLGQQQIETVVIDRKPSINTSSRAIGVTPPSLAILDKLGLTRSFIGMGVKVEGAAVHGKKHPLGSLGFRDIPHDFRFILSIPQRRTEELLSNNLQQYQCVRVLRNHEVREYGCEQDACQVKAFPVDNKQDGEGASGTLVVNGQYLCASDGFRSTLRDLAAIPWKGKTCRDTFLMADYADRTDLGSDAHLYFTPEGSVESFPLPDQKRRWVIQTDHYMEDPPEGFLARQVESRSGHVLPAEDQLSQSSFRVYTYIMKTFHSERMLFLGDAAHTISPIGGQGMNTGFADAGLAGWLLPQLLGQGHSARIFRIYSRCRRRAAKSAARRAILSMKTGTVRGNVFSAIRNMVLKLVLNTAASRALPKHYAMLSIPFHNAESVKKRYRSVLQDEGIDCT